MTTTTLPLTADEFFKRLKAMGLVPENAEVQSIVIHADWRDSLVRLSLETLPMTDVSEALK